MQQAASLTQLCNIIQLHIAGDGTALSADSTDTVTAFVCISKLNRKTRPLPSEQLQLSAFVQGTLLPLLQPHIKDLGSSACAQVIRSLGSVHITGSDAATTVDSLLQQAGSPSAFTPGAMVSMFKGLQMLQRHPGNDWLAAAVAAIHKWLRSYYHKDTVIILQLLAAVSYAPEPLFMEDLVHHMQNKVPNMSPSQAVQVMACLQVLGYVPPTRWLSQYYQHTRRKLSGCSIQELAVLTGALKWAKAVVPVWWAAEFVARSWPLITTAAPGPLAKLLYNTLALDMRPPGGWLQSCVVQLRSHGAHVTTADMALVAAAMCKLPPTHVVLAEHHRWLTASLKRISMHWSVLSLQESLYIMQAVAQLGVHCDEQWLQQGLGSLQQKLAGADPSLLAAVLNVYTKYPAIVQPDWVDSVLSIAEQMSGDFSNMELVMLLVPCAQLGLTASKESVLATLIRSMLKRVQGMGLVQLYRCTNALQTHVRRVYPAWYWQLLQFAAKALAAKAT